MTRDKLINVRVKAAALEQFDEVCKRLGISRSDAMRDAMKSWLVEKGKIKT